MKSLAKIALAAFVLTGAAALTAAPADARVVVGVGFGPGYDGYGPGPGYSCDPYSRWYNPRYCDYYDDDDYGPYGYYGPAFGVGYYGGFGHGHFGHGGWGHGGWGHGGWGHGGHHH